MRLLETILKKNGFSVTITYTAKCVPLQAPVGGVVEVRWLSGVNFKLFTKAVTLQKAYNQWTN